MKWLQTKIRVRYAETDKMGIVHHSNYYVWFELGRSEYCRERGFSYLEMEEKDGAFMVVAESYCRYKSPAYYEDILLVRTGISAIRSRSIQFVYQIVRPLDNELIAEGETLHFVTNSHQKIRSIPQNYKSKLLGVLDETDEVIPKEFPPS